MDLLVIGTGYVGLVTGTCLAEMGHHVVCLDINQKKIDQLNSGVIPIYEPGLEEMVKRNMKAHRLHFTTDYASAVAAALICFIAVDTPMAADGHADLHSVRKVATSIAQHMDGYRIIVNKSTVPVGTANQVRQIVQSTLDERNVPFDFDVVCNPEFLKEGNAIQDCMKPDRVIIGTDSQRAAAIMKEIYSPFMLSHDRLMIMGIASAEVTKYAANAMLATRISFMNELAGFCELTGADINTVRKGIGSDQRIGYKFLYAGPGFGGSCLPKDIQALQGQARALGYEMSLVDAVAKVNERQKQVIGKKIIEYFLSQGRISHNILRQVGQDIMSDLLSNTREHYQIDKARGFESEDDVIDCPNCPRECEKCGLGMKGKTIGILGLSFKPDTDDMRESASLVLIEQMLQAGASLRLFDPAAMENAKKCLPDCPQIVWCEDEADAATGADALVVMTEWKQFRFLDFSLILSLMQGKAFFDSRNQYNPMEMAKRGFDYMSIGRSPVFAEEVLENIDEGVLTTLRDHV